MFVKGLKIHWLKFENDGEIFKLFEMSQVKFFEVSEKMEIQEIKALVRSEAKAIMQYGYENSDHELVKPHKIEFLV